MPLAREVERSRSRRSSVAPRERRWCCRDERADARWSVKLDRDVEQTAAELVVEGHKRE